MKRVLQLVRATLREIFDEAAYERFLRRQGSRASQSSYAAFLRERQSAVERRPRCC